MIVLRGQMIKPKPQSFLINAQMLQVKGAVIALGKSNPSLRRSKLILTGFSDRTQRHKTRSLEVQI